MVNEMTQAGTSGAAQGSVNLGSAAIGSTAHIPPTMPSQRYESGNLWLAYVRMIGMPTGLCGSIGAVLHQLECSLRDEPTHWSATVLLVGIGLSLAFALWLGTSRGTRQLAIVAVLSSSILLGTLGWMDLCDEHQAFSLVMLGVSVAIGCAVIQSRREMSSPRATLERDDHAPQTGRGAIFPKREQPSTAIANTTSSSPGPEDAAQSSESEEAIVDNVASDLGEVVVGRQRPFWVRHAFGILLVTGFLIYMVIVPTIGMLVEWMTPEGDTTRVLTDMSLTERVRLQTVSGVVMLMFLAAGASIGSFLNVVIYRLPRRRALLWPPSACPNCQARVTGKDNLPILAWLKLGGRCRECHVEISVRYPIIEALVGSIFVLFCYRELLSGGANLPIRTPNFYNGIVWILLYTKWDLVTIYFFHILLLVILLAWGMINYDRFRVPRVSVLLTSGLFLCLPSIFPHLNPTIAGWHSEQLPLPSSVLATVTGFLTGALVGLFLEYAFCYLRTNELNSLSVPSERTAQLELALAGQNNDVQPVEVQRGSLAPRPGNSIVDERESGPQSPAASASAPLELPAPLELDGAVELYGAASKAPAVRGNAAASLALVGAALGFEAAAVVALLTVVGGLLTLVVPFLANKLAGKSFARPIPLALVTFGCTVLLLLSWSVAHHHFSQQL